MQYYSKRSATFIPPGVVNGLTDLVVSKIKAYPNPTFTNSFSLNYPPLNGKEVVLSLIAPDGRVVHHAGIPIFSADQPVQLSLPLSGLYIVLIRQGNKVYTSQILFSQK